VIIEASAIRTVVFTGGPGLDSEVTAFLEKLESEQGIELAAIFSQSPRRGISGIVRDRWKRRGLLAIPLLLQLLCRSAWRAVISPRIAGRRRRLLRNLAPRTHYVKSLHADDVISRVRDLEPQLGLVYGGPIVKRELFGIPLHGTLGIHHGKVPEYRGKKTTFWAMYNGEDEVGVTIQRIGDRLDGGDIVMQALLPVRKQPLPRIKKQLEKAGIDLYIRAIHAVRDGSATYTAQPDKPITLYTDPGATDIIRFWYGYLLRLIRN
jgi:folate-dependent phosphoribosylglycinamide formyltransferase PurN